MSLAQVLEVYGPWLGVVFIVLCLLILLLITRDDETGKRAQLQVKRQEQNRAWGWDNQQWSETRPISSSKSPTPDEEAEFWRSSNWRD